MSEENFEAARPPDDGSQQASQPHAQYDKDSIIENDHGDTNTDTGGTQGGGDTLTHEVGHWLGNDDPDPDSLTSEPAPPPEPAGPYHQGDTAYHEVGHWLGNDDPHPDSLTSEPSQPTPLAEHEVGHTLGFRHEHVVRPSADADKPRPRYFDGRFLAVIAIIGLIGIGGLVILLSTAGSAPGALKTIVGAQTDYNNAPTDDSSDSGFFWFFSPNNTELADSCVDDYAALMVPICVRNNTGPGDVITIQGAGFGYAEEYCGPVPVIRVVEPDTSAAISEAITIVGEIGSEFTASLQAQAMQTGMLLGVKTVDIHPDENVQLVLVVLPDAQTDGEKKDDYFIADSFSFGYADYGEINLWVRSADSSAAAADNDQILDILIDLPSTSPLEFDFFYGGDDTGGTPIALMAFVHESDLLPHLPPLCEPVSLPPPDMTEEPTDEPPDSSVPVSTEEPTDQPAGDSADQPPAVCGDLICDPGTENSDICPNDCQCVDDGICAPGEGDNCQDCGSSAGVCGAVCTDSSHCSQGLACAGGVCWDAVICGGADPGGGGSGDGGSCGYGECNCEPEYRKEYDPDSGCTTVYDTCGNSIEFCD